jgi:hypothetical protein
MHIDTTYLHHWMQAIRQSNNPMRTMDAFWSGQLKSKEWLINHLDEHIHHKVDIDIYGGWVGVLASMLFQSNILINNIRSIDIDPYCEHTANTMNQIEYNQKRFTAITNNMVNVPSTAHVVINTSCEHITQHDYEKWLSIVSKDSLIVLQSNNYDIPEHIRLVKDIDEFKQQTILTNIIEAVELELPLYKRFMVIGYNN